MSSVALRSLIIVSFCWLNSMAIFAQSTVHFEATEILENRYQMSNSKHDSERTFTQISKQHSSSEQRFLNEITFAKMLSKYGHLKLACNVLRLQEVGDFGAQNCLPALNLIRSKKLHLSTEPPISCRCCYRLLFLY